MSAPSYRFGPRQGGRSASRIDWERAGRIALVIVFVVVLLSYVRPVLNLYGSWQDSNDQGRELTQLKHENERLRTQAESLDSGTAAERAARTQGYYRTGEAPYSVNGL